VVPSVTVRRLGTRPRPRSGADVDRGAVALLVALLMVVFAGLAAIVVDLGFARDRVRAAQNAADAAALAVANCFASATSGCNNGGGATQVAQQYIAANGWTFDASTVAIDPAAQTATIALPAQQTPTLFAGAIGFRSPSVAARARATWNSAAPVTCVLCVLQDFQGQIGDITLGGGLAVDGALNFNNANGSVTINGSGSVAFGGSWNGNGTFTVNGAPATPVRLNAPFTDPYGGLALPPVNNPAVGDVVDLAAPAVAGSGACAPGNYTDLSTCSSLTGGGIYIVTGDGSRNDTPVTVPGANAPDTLIYLTCGRKTGSTVNYQRCSPGSAGAYLAGAGNAASVVQGRTQGAYRGFAVIYDPARDADQKLAGNGVLTLSGNFYGASVVMDFRGNGAASILAGGNVVVGTVMLKGNGSQNQHLDVPGGGAPPSIAPGTPIHLIP
jgi:Flp pilus assembly protein TadG